MASTMRNWRLAFLGPITVLLFTTLLSAAEARKRPVKIGTYAPDAQTVEMFAAIEKGDIAVKLIPKDSTESNVLIENKTKQPLNVKLPEAFAGVPVLAQAFGGGPGGGGTRRGDSGTRNQNQGFGGGFGGMGMGGGMWSIPPEKVGQIKVPTVCLDHGLDEPRPAIPYEIKPIESYTNKPGVRELCAALGKGQVSQRAAQAAAWHLNNGMSWQELAAKRIHRANGTTQPYFSPLEIQTGVQIAAAALHTAKEREKEKANAPATPAETGLSVR